MSSYGARVAALYDLFYQDKPYAEEVHFIESVFRKCGDGAVRRILDVAAGTGSHAIELTRLGYEVTCVDRSEGMLERARAKGRRAALEMRCVQQDMRSFRIESAAFDAAICLFDSIGYVVSDEGLDDALRSIRAHLRADGLLILEYWHAPAMLGSYEPVRVRRWRTEEGEVIRISETRLNPDERSATVKYSIVELGLDGRYRCTEEVHANRYFDIEEIRDRLAMHGLQVIANCSGYDWSDPVSDSTWHVLTVARNAQRA